MKSTCLLLSSRLGSGNTILDPKGQKSHMSPKTYLNILLIVISRFNSLITHLTVKLDNSAQYREIQIDKNELENDHKHNIGQDSATSYITPGFGEIGAD